MKFYKLGSKESLAKLIAAKISKHLAAKENVLWLLSGGSFIEIEVMAAKLLAGCNHLNNLVVSLADERFGPPGHADSNWQQLMEVGFSLPGAVLQPVLTGRSLAATAADYDDFIDRQLKTASYRLGMAGIGGDGHTLGIKPGSPAVDSPDLVMAYKWDDYERITITAKAAAGLDEIIVYAVGREKWPQIKRLKQNTSATEQPAQILKQCRQVLVFNDYSGNEFSEESL